jgi:hypothetical protein
MKGGSKASRSRSSHPASHRSGGRSKGSGGGSFEVVPPDEEEDEDESQYSDEQDDESSYESDLNSSKASTHQTFNIAQKESNRVQVWRTVLSVMLVITAAVVIVAIYVFLAQNEESEFQSAVCINDNDPVVITPERAELCCAVLFSRVDSLSPCPFLSSV